MDSQNSHDQEWQRPRPPSGYENPVPDGRYNLVVIGAGTAGLVAATGAAALGARVALIERDRIGGSRLNVGDVPSKLLMRAARVAADARRSHEFGVRHSNDAQVDFGAVMHRIREVSAQIAAVNSVARLKERGIDVYFGVARFEDGSHVSVEGKRIAFARSLIATGSSPAMPKIARIDNLRPLTNETLFSLSQVPQRLAIIGGGPIGCEMSQAFARFGSRVTIYEKEPRILPPDDLAPAEIVKTAMQRDGVIFRLACTDMRFETANGVRRLNGTSSHSIFADEFDHVLVSSGRVPNVGRLNLEAAHVDYDENGVLVNDHLRTTNRRIYAAGDVCSPYKFTHAADAQARIVIANALFFGIQRASSLLIPWCTFTDPEIAHVGIGESDPRSGHYNVMDLSMNENDRAAMDGESEGMLRIYHDRRGGIQGATLVATHAGEMIGELVVAMRHGARLGSLASDIHPYPTQSEIIKRAGDMYRRTLLTPTVSSFLRRIMVWRR